MNTMQYQNAWHRSNMLPSHTNRISEQAPAEWVEVVLDALDDVGGVVSSESFANPDTLTPYEITAYALALMHLRECASRARFERLTDACDALAVTVSRLIEDRGCASRAKCEALTRFVAHAHAMIPMSAGHPAM